MISIKSNHTRAEIKELETLAAKLLESLSRLAPGPVRDDLLAEIASLNVRIDALKRSMKATQA